MNHLNVKEALTRHGLAPSKRLGQNFLVQPHIAEQIVEAADIVPGSTVVELGVGLGSLTIPLAARAGRVVGIEIDAGIVEYHRKSDTLPPNVELRHQDLLETDYSALSREEGGALTIIANLPYSITNPLLFKLLEHHQALAKAVLMVQKEVALRLNAAVNTKEYGVLTVVLGGCAEIKTLLAVGPGNFYPRPKVDSLVVGIKFNDNPMINDLARFERLRAVVDTAFRQRRKTLLNSLSAATGLGIDRQQAAAALDKAGIEPTLRAENLSTEDFIRLAEAIPKR